MDGFPQPPSAAKSPRMFLPLTAIVLTSLFFAWLWGEQANFDLDSFAAYAGTHEFGDHCEYATDLWGPGDSFDKVLHLQRVYTQMAMPYRNALKRPDVNVDGYIVTRCHVDLSHLSRDTYAFINIGVIQGHSAVYLNDRLKVLLDSKKFLEIPLLPDERVRDMTVTMISRRDERSRMPGLATLAPVVYGESQEKAAEIIRISERLWSELPMARSNFCFGLMLCFGVAWLLGMRYADIGWMVVVCAVLGISASVDYLVQYHWRPWLPGCVGALTLMRGIVLIAFVLSFLRVRLPTRLLEITAVVIPGGYWLMHWLFEEQTAFIALNNNFRVEWASCGAVFAYAAWSSLRRSRIFPGRRQTRLRFFAAICVLGSGLMFYQIIVLDSAAIMLAQVVDIALAAVFGAFLMADLVVFQRRFFREREDRQSADSETARLTEVLALGAAVQRLLLPKAEQSIFGDYELAFRYTPFENLAGDWIYHWQDGDKVIALVGDVTGKGPAAALAMTAIVSTLHAARAQGDDVETCIKKINSALHLVFEAHLLTTLAAVVAHGSGQIDYCAAGSPGWFLLAGGRAQTLVCRGDLLGLNAEINLQWKTAQLPVGALFLTVTDGYADGVRQTVAMLDVLAPLAGDHIDMQAVYQALAQGGAGFGNPDDRTVLALRRKA